MAKTRRDEKGRKYLAHEDIVHEELRSADAQAAYMERRFIQEVARAVRALREGAGLSQAQLAAKIGTKQPAIARLETSQYHTPQWQMLNRIGLALNAQLSFSMGAVEENKPLVRIVGKRTSSKGHTDNEI